MANRTFTDNDFQNPVDAEWLNEVNRLVHVIFQNPGTTAAARAALGLSDAQIATLYHNQVPILAQAAVEAGESAEAGRISPLRLAQAIAALEGERTHRRIYLAAGSPHTWTKPDHSGFAGVRVWVIGGGGGGGGSGTTGGKVGAGGGGGAAGYKEIAAAALGATETATVGAGGAAGAAGNFAGAAGGASSFGSHMTAGGGGGGNHGASGDWSGQGGGGAISGHDIGEGGSTGAGVGPNTNNTVGYGGSSGTALSLRSVWGSNWHAGGGILGQWAGMGGYRNLSDINSVGSNGGNFGGGGGGGKRASTDGTDNPGGSGAPGVVVIEEIYE